MNRELKFRAWNTIVHRMQSFTLKDLEEQGAPIQWHILKIDQYIGRKDKKGVDIYEGDIVTDGYGTYVVKWFDSLTWDSGGSPHPGFYLQGKHIDDNELDYHTGFNGVEVIGNIHQHPELLQPKSQS